ncbi:MAG: hypothetical protein ACTSRU_12550 [Candidatus Hodarchaeales archaeon]
MIYHIHNSALAAQTKIDLMAWIGILPEPHATLHQLEIRSYRTALVDENVEAEHLQIIEEKIPMVHNLMDDGLGILMKKLETQDCIDCGKCDDLKNIIIQLMDFHNNDVDAIIAEIEEKFGDIEASKGGGMPGHRTDGNGPGIRVVELGRGEGNMMDLLKMINDHPDADGMIVHQREGEDPITDILTKIFGPDDKDKLH